MADDKITRQFTAAEVRALIQQPITQEACPDLVAEMLEAFAARLDRDEQSLPSNARYGLLMWLQECSDKGSEWSQKWREEGRREVLAEVAKLKPLWDCCLCAFCDQDSMDENDPTLKVSPHSPDCLWFRARQAADSAKLSGES